MTADWTIRTSVPEDENCIVSTWLKGFSRSRDIREGFPQASLDGHGDQYRYWKIYQPIVEALVRNAEVRVLCDPARSTHEPSSPAVIWAWVCCTDDTVHWVCVKRSAAQTGLAEEMVRDLLGDRLEREQKTTFELTDMNERTLRVPKIWKRERRWLTGMRALSGLVLDGDNITVVVANHLLDLEREEWRPNSERAA